MDKEFRNRLAGFGIGLGKGSFSVEGREAFFFTGKDLPLRGTRGLHIGTLSDDGLRPTLDACQLAREGISKTKFLDVGEKAAKRWMCGLDLDMKEGIPEAEYVLVRWGRYVLGPGKPRNGRILNNLPKNRRLPLSLA